MLSESKAYYKLIVSKAAYCYCGKKKPLWNIIWNLEADYTNFILLYNKLSQT